MTETATISGGKHVTLSLSASQVAASRAALAALSTDYSNSKVLTSTSEAPTSGYLNAYNIDAVAGSTYSLPAGGQTIVVYNTDSETPASVTINGAAGATDQVIIGNNGNDTINSGGGSGTIIVGNGNNTINLTSGVQSISAGTGFNGISASGNDTITLGTGNDTLTATGSATVTGGSGNLYYSARSGVDSTVYAGSGSETLIGGSGKTFFYGSTTGGSDYMVGGTGANTFVGGNGSDTMVASSGTHQNSVFEFASSVSGGVHTIDGFVLSASSKQADIVELKGYTASDIKSITQMHGNTIIKLDDHTQITITGVTNFNAGDIKFTS